MKSPTLLSKADAKKTGSAWYFTGIPCVNGHVDKRYTNTGICYECKRQRNKKMRDLYPETYKTIKQRTYSKTPTAVHVARSYKWKANNPERVREIKKKNKEKYRLKYNAAEAARVRVKRKANPQWAVAKNISKYVWESLKGGKQGVSWKALVDFTLDELITHLESQFRNGMSWTNYGSLWHVDHIRPLSWFNLETEFKQAWALTNLQPLEASLNMSKCNRYEG